MKPSDLGNTPWGKCSPKGINNIILLAAKLGLGRGKLKGFLHRSWLNRNKFNPVDISYHDIKLRLHPWDNTIESKILFSSRLREGEELKNLKKFKDKGAFIDIGANAGYYSLMACKFGFPKILAFEPNPLMFNRLNFNVLANSFENIVSRFQLALGDKPKQVEFAVAPEGDMGGSHMLDIETKSISQDSITVQVMPLLEVLKEQNVSDIGVLKIDVEGFEDVVLFPFFENVSRDVWPKMIIIEPSPDDWSRDILGWMKDNGYSIQNQTKGNVILVLDSAR